MSVATLIDVSALYASHGDWLKSWLKRHTRCSSRAADLAQDTFCRLIEARQAAAVRDPRAYLATVARRLLIDDIRRREVERAYVAILTTQAVDVDLLTPERIAEAAQLLSAILGLLDTLPDRTRQAFILVRLDGLPYADAGRLLGISERMMKRHVAQVYVRCYALAYPD